MKKFISLLICTFMAIILVSCNEAGLDRELFDDSECKHELVYTKAYSDDSFKPDYPDMIVETCTKCWHEATLKLSTDQEEYEYSGSVIKPGSVTYSGSWLGTESLAGKWVYENNTSATNLGTKPAVSITLYGVELKKQFVITKKKLAEPTAIQNEFGFIDDYIRFIDSSYLVNYDPTLMKASGDLSAKDITSGTDYKIMFELKDKENYHWQNHESDYIVEVHWKIIDSDTGGGGMTVDFPDMDEIPAGTVTLTTRTDTFVLSFNQTNAAKSKINLYYWSVDGRVVSEGGDGSSGTAVTVPSIDVSKEQLEYKLFFYGETDSIRVDLTVFSDGGCTSCTYRLTKDDLNKL